MGDARSVASHMKRIQNDPQRGDAIKEQIVLERLKVDNALLR